MSTRGGQPRSTRFVMSADPQGNLYVYCDVKSCNWIRPVVRNSNLNLIERMTQRHNHKEAV